MNKDTDKDINFCLCYLLLFLLPALVQYTFVPQQSITSIMSNKDTAVVSGSSADYRNVVNANAPGGVEDVKSNATSDGDADLQRLSLIHI